MKAPNTEPRPVSINSLQEVGTSVHHMEHMISNRALSATVGENELETISYSNGALKEEYEVRVSEQIVTKLQDYRNEKWTQNKHDTE